MTSNLEHRNLAHYVLQFQDAVVEHSERIALRHADGAEIRYAELNARANRLASYLLGLELVQPNAIVAILLDRSIELVTTILAVWKCSAAYALLDPGHSDARLNELLSVVAPRTLLSASAHLSGRALELDGRRIVSLDAVADDVAKRPANNLNLEYAARDKSYVFFTSGSTGRPKAALVEQIGSVNHMHAKISSIAMDAASIMAQTASLNFNIFNWQTFAPLLRGATTVIYPDVLVRSPLHLARQGTSDAVSFLQVVPTLFSHLLEVVENDSGLLRSLSMMLLTGEKAKTHDVNRWFALRPKIPVLNSYGCTEAADDSTHHVMTQPLTQNHVPVGKPIANTTIRIVQVDDSGGVTLDPEGRPMLCRAGEVGQIWIAGDIVVGLGYLDNEVETAKYFGEDPWSGERLFKIGDLGYTNEHGEIVCLGRADKQVKINGQRLDLAEVETAIRSASREIKDVVVTPHTTPNGRQFLTAVFTADRRFKILELRGFKGILVHLPQHLIPHFWIQVSEMPVLAGSGKVDRRQLAELQRAAFAADAPTGFVRADLEMPTTDDERAIARIWDRVLGLRELGLNEHSVGINECFFNLGGDSLTAQRLGAELEKIGYIIDFEAFYKGSAIKERRKYLRRAEG
jgi:amino acid adenylation domain-containing protein